jgi:hypothetical protein
MGHRRVGHKKETRNRDMNQPVDLHTGDWEEEQRSLNAPSPADWDFIEISVIGTGESKSTVGDMTESGWEILCDHLISVSEAIHFIEGDVRRLKAAMTDWSVFILEKWGSKSIYFGITPDTFILCFVSWLLNYSLVLLASSHSWQPLASS